MYIEEEEKSSDFKDVSSEIFVYVSVYIDRIMASLHVSNQSINQIIFVFIFDYFLCSLNFSYIDNSKSDY